MNAYSTLAAFYNELNRDVPYEKWADFIEKVFRRHRVSPRLILDLACGTGTLSYLMSKRGYEMIASDQSVEMLNVAREKCGELSVPPVFINQRMQGLDLFGTVDAVLCCLDSINYLTEYRDLVKCFQGVHLFLEPGGLFLFDVNTPRKLRNLSGRAFISEGEGVYCAWRAAFFEKQKLCRYDFDIFAEENGAWKRSDETHFERAYSVLELGGALKEAGFRENPFLYGELKLKAPNEADGRVFFAVKKEKE